MSSAPRPPASGPPPGRGIHSYCSLGRRLRPCPRAEQRLPVLRHRPLRGLSAGKGLAEAAKADFLPLTAFEVGLFGRMALMAFVFLPRPAPASGHRRLLVPHADRHGSGPADRLSGQRVADPARHQGSAVSEQVRLGLSPRPRADPRPPGCPSRWPSEARPPDGKPIRSWCPGRTGTPGVQAWTAGRIRQAHRLTAGRRRQNGVLKQPFDDRMTVFSIR